MKSTTCLRPVLMAFLLLPILVSGCATDRARLAAAEEAKAQDAVVADILAIGAQRAPLPVAPPECKGPIRSGVAPTDRVDVALVRQDAAIGKANATMAACAAFYDKIRAQGGPR